MSRFRCLKLNGFVIDHLPFEHELSRIVLLTCGDACIDAGMRAPKTKHAAQNKWSRVVNNVGSHCLIQWPKWTGIFDSQGDQRDAHGNIVPQDLGLSTPLDEFPSSPTLPSTVDSLCMKNLDDTLDGIKEESYFPTRNLSSLIAQTSVGAASNASTRVSEVPTPTAASFTGHPEPIPFTGGSIISSSFSSIGHSLVMVRSSDSNDLPSSTYGSFEEISTQNVDVALNGSTVGSKSPTTGTDVILKKESLKHKVRRSWDWLSGSSS